MAELISSLESDDPKLVAETKQKFHEQFNATKEPCLVNVLYEAYLSSNSMRLIEVLVNVKEPHHAYLFDRISESIKGSKENIKIQALTLFGHIVASQPAWIYKITHHSLMKDLIKLLKTETDILTLLSALLALIVLLPLIPSLMGSYLQEVFDIFCRLAGWNCQEPGKMFQEQMAHLQVALYALFLRLYGMYPCNFLAYLRDQYRNKNLFPIFCHTIKPMLDTVKMHPHLVTTSKANETSTERWKMIGAQDIIVECEKFSLDLPDRCSHEQCFISPNRPRSSTATALVSDPAFKFSSVRIDTPTENMVPTEGYFFSPSMVMYCPTPPVCEKSLPTPIPYAQGSVQTPLLSSITQLSQESSSPPEAAIEATPETTPVRDNRMNVRMPPLNSAIAKAHTFVSRAKPLGSGHNTPISSQPSSPMRKEVSPFNFQEGPRHSSAFGNPKKESATRLQKLMQDRSQMGDANSETSGRSRPFMMIPTSPSKVLSSEIPVPGSPILMQRLDSPLSQEDEEVSQIVRQGETVQNPGIRQCDSVLHEVEGIRGIEEDVDNCEQEHGSPCAEGGLHMPNSKSINDLTMRLRRLRYHSQCADENDIGRQNQRSTGSSPGNAVSFPNNISVRRANSCPEMKKSPIAPGKENISKTLLETDEDGNADVQENKSIGNGTEVVDDRKKSEKGVCLNTAETQTENFWPMPYDHLFLSIFPSLAGNEANPVPLIKKQENTQCANIYTISDKFIDTSFITNEKDLVTYLKEVIELFKLQLHFEKHRREMHAMKNRRLLADSKNTKALEEHKEALMDTVLMKQKDIDRLKDDVDVIKIDKECKEQEALDNSQFFEQQLKTLQNECTKLKEKVEEYQKHIESLRDQNSMLDVKWQAAESTLLGTQEEVKIAREQADAGEKGRLELEQVNKEVLLLGELQLKYQERLHDLAVTKKTDLETRKLVDSCKHEMQVLRQQLDSKKNVVEACGARISELEAAIQKHDDFCTKQKKQLNDVKEESFEQLKVVEAKYQTQWAINRSLEEKIMELWRRIDTLNAKLGSLGISCEEDTTTVCPGTSSDRANTPAARPSTSTVHPNTSSDRPSTSLLGLRPHSPPLSCLAPSAEESAASGPSEVKNLHKIISRKDDNE